MARALATGAAMTALALLAALVWAAGQGERADAVQSGSALRVGRSAALRATAPLLPGSAGDGPVLRSPPTSRAAAGSSPVRVRVRAADASRAAARPALAPRESAAIPALADARGTAGSPLQLRRTHIRPRRLEVDIEGVDGLGGRAIGLWRLDAPRGEPVLLAHAQSEPDGTLWFRSLLLPEAGAVLAAAALGSAPGPGALYVSPSRAPLPPRVFCDGARVVALPPGPGYALQVVDERGIPAREQVGTLARDGARRGGRVLATGAQPHRVASLRRDGASSSWHPFDPAPCAQGGP